MKTLPSISILFVLAFAATSNATDWISAPSTYTHSPEDGQRVTQYSPIGPFYTQQRSDYSKSGYRQRRSSLRVGDSADNIHIVEKWGQAVAPYGEWLRPYRPYSVPAAAWSPNYGAPFGVGGFGGGGFGGGGFGGGGFGGGGFGGGGFGHPRPGLGGHRDHDWFDRKSHGHKRHDGGHHAHEADHDAEVDDEADEVADVDVEKHYHLHDYPGAPPYPQFNNPGWSWY